MDIRKTLFTLMDGRGLRPKTYSTYKTKLNRFCDYCEVKKITDLRKIDFEFADGYFRQAKFRSNTTRNHYREVLFSFFEELKKTERIKKNPFALVRILPETRQGKMFFNENQVRQLTLALEETPELFMACKLLYYCFIRNGEIANLPLSDIDIDNRVIRLHASYSKNKKTQPVIIPDEFINDVRDWYIQQQKAGANYFVTKPNGEKIMKGDWFRRNHEKIQQRLGYGRRYSFYSWKHTGAVQFYKATRDIKALQLQMRHHSLDETDTYMREFGVVQATTIREHKLPKSPLKVAA